MTIFTPILNGVRVRWKKFTQISGNMQARGLGFHGLVRGPDGRVYRVYGRSCGAPHCHCDAEVILDSSFKTKRRSGGAS